MQTFHFSSHFFSASRQSRIHHVLPPSRSEWSTFRKLYLYCATFEIPSPTSSTTTAFAKKHLTDPLEAIAGAYLFLIGKTTMSNFFLAFAGFVPNPRAPVDDEFNRLANFMQWKSKNSKHKSNTYWKMRGQCLLQECNAQFGSDSKLATWQDLCIELGVEPVPNSIKQCKLVRLFLLSQGSHQRQPDH